MYQDHRGGGTGIHALFLKKNKKKKILGKKRGGFNLVLRKWVYVVIKSRNLEKKQKQHTDKEAEKEKQFQKKSRLFPHPNFLPFPTKQPPPV